MSKKSFSQNDRRFLFILTFCTLSGAILSGSAGMAQSGQCSTGSDSTAQCMAKSPAISAVEGAVMGVFAGAGAAIAVSARRFF